MLVLEGQALACAADFCLQKLLKLSFPSLSESVVWVHTPGQAFASLDFPEIEDASSTYSDLSRLGHGT